MSCTNPEMVTTDNMTNGNAGTNGKSIIKGRNLLLKNTTTLEKIQRSH
jgi:hypothetical protein